MFAGMVVVERVGAVGGGRGGLRSVGAMDGRGLGGSGWDRRREVVIFRRSGVVCSGCHAGKLDARKKTRQVTSCSSRFPFLRAVEQFLEKGGFFLERI